MVREARLGGCVGVVQGLALAVACLWLTDELKLELRTAGGDGQGESGGGRLKSRMMDDG